MLRLSADNFDLANRAQASQRYLAQSARKDKDFCEHSFAMYRLLKHCRRMNCARTQNESQVAKNPRLAPCGSQAIADRGDQ
jgi:hypothetical protein